MMRARTLICLGSLLALLAACGRAPGGAGGNGPTAPAQATTPARPGFDGGSVGNGGDDTPLDEGSAWFLGTRIIHYCVQVAPDFGVSRAGAEASVRSAMYTWRMYALRRAGRGNHAITSSIARAMFGAAYPVWLTLESELLPSCDGSEDLTFYLGVEAPEVTRFRRRFNHPLAFAQRRSYDENTGWGSGFVWIQRQGSHGPGFPDWRHEQALSAMLLHEIGHVMGCAHVRGTIMEEDIVRDLRALTQRPDASETDWLAFANIDRTRALLLPQLTLGFHLALATNGHVVSGAEAPGYVTSRGALVLSPGDHDLVPWGRVTSGARTLGINLLDARWQEVTLYELARQRNDAAVFKTVFRPFGADRAMVSSLATESVTFAGSDPVTGTQFLVFFNGDNYRLRVVELGSGGAAPTEVYRR